jgi:hypothetical protein
MATADAGNVGADTVSAPYERIVLEPPPDLDKEIEDAKGS